MALIPHHIGCGPAEVLDLIFSFCDSDDIKNIRLVNRYWRDAAILQVNKQIRLKLDDDTDNGQQTTFQQKVEFLRADEFQNVKLCRSVPSAPFETHFKTSLTSLLLKDVTFATVIDLRRLIFQVFPSLTEVGLTGVLFSNGAKSEGEIKIMPDNVPKVRKLGIDRSCDREDRDIFKIWNPGELVRHYAGSLEELNIWQSRVSSTRNNQNIFLDLYKNNVRLTHLSYGPEIEKENLESFKSFIEKCGNKLISIKINFQLWDDFNSLLGSEGVVLNSLESISIVEQCWTYWKGGPLPKLKKLFQNQARLHSFEFMDLMPKLEVLDLMVAQCGCEFFHVPYANPNIHTLRLDWYFAGGISTYARLFPNVRKLLIGGQLGACRKCIRVDVLPIMAPVCSGWPNLIELELSGRWDKYLANFRNESKLGNVDIQELQCLTNLRNLRSFVNVDEQSKKILWSDESAVNVFLRMPSLRTLRLGNCAMTRDVIEKLREKLMVFTFNRLRPRSTTQL